jgi:hypothetical protein
MRRLPSATARTQRSSRHIFVVGLESSGTRLLAVSILKCILGAQASRWNGDWPPCVRHGPSATSISHVSLPSGNVCDRKKLPPVVSLRGAGLLMRGRSSSDLCAHDQPKKHSACGGPGPFCGRYVLNLTSVLLHDAHSRLVIVRRHYGVALYSKLFLKGGLPIVHCKHHQTAQHEMELGVGLLHDALRADEQALLRAPKRRSRVFVLDHDFLDDGWQWRRLSRFLDVPTPACEPPVDVEKLRRVAGANVSDRPGEIARLRLAGLNG